MLKPGSTKRRDSPLWDPKRGVPVPVLTIIEGPGMGRQFKLYPEHRAYLVGRDQGETTIRLDDDTVSREHARLYVHSPSGGDIVVRLQDLGSTNGTHVNDEKVDSVDLRPGDKVRFGDVLIRFDRLDQHDLRYHDRVAEKLAQAESDPVTGLLTKRFYMTEVAALAEQWASKESGYAIILIDLDEFKSINDRFGHEVGDGVLHWVGSEIASHLRRSDVGVRWGGDELVLVIPAVTHPHALEIAERIRAAVRTRDWSVLAPGLEVTVSLGMAVLESGQSLDEVFRRADETLRRAKSQGRDRVGHD